MRGYLRYESTGWQFLPVTSYGSWTIKGGSIAENRRVRYQSKHDSLAVFRSHLEIAAKLLANMSNSPRKMPPRPKILLPVPGQYYPQPATGMGYVSTPYVQTPMPMTPVSGQPQMFYSNRASEFVFTQFKGIKDLTKSGLSVGEKSAYWLYEKVRRMTPEGRLR